MRAGDIPNISLALLAADETRHSRSASLVSFCQLLLPSSLSQSTSPMWGILTRDAALVFRPGAIMAQSSFSPCLPSDSVHFISLHLVVISEANSFRMPDLTAGV